MKKAKKVDFKGLKKSMKSDKPQNTAKKAPRKPVKVKTTNKSTATRKVRGKGQQTKTIFKKDGITIKQTPQGRNIIIQ